MCSEIWPLCKCGDPVDPRRVAALDGVVRCMACPCPPPSFFIVEQSKQGHVVTSDPAALIGSFAQPGMRGYSVAGENSVYMKLDSKR